MVLNRDPKGVGGGSTSESCQWVYERLFKKDSDFKDLLNSHNQCLKMAKKLMFWVISTPRPTFLYFLGLPKGSGGLVGKSTPSESAQGFYERLLKKIQTLKISTTYAVSASIWLKSQFFRYSCILLFLWSSQGP